MKRSAILTFIILVFWGFHLPSELNGDNKKYPKNHSDPPINESYIDKKPRKSTENREDHLKRIKILVEEKYLDQALFLVKEHLKIYPDDLEFLIIKGKILLDLGKIQESHKAFKKVLEFDKNNQVATKYIHKIEKSPVGASIDTDSEKALDMFAKGEEAYGKKDYERALTFYEKAAEIDPHFSKAFLYMGDCYYSMMKYRSAKQAYLKCLDINPNNAQAHHYLSDAYFKLLEYKQSFYHLFKACSTDPDYVNACMKLKKMKKFFHQNKILAPSEIAEIDNKITDETKTDPNIVIELNPEQFFSQFRNALLNKDVAEMVRLVRKNPHTASSLQIELEKKAKEEGKQAETYRFLAGILNKIHEQIKSESPFEYRISQLSKIDQAILNEMIKAINIKDFETLAKIVWKHPEAASRLRKFMDDYAKESGKNEAAFLKLSEIIGELLKEPSAKPDYKTAQKKSIKDSYMKVETSYPNPKPELVLQTGHTDRVTAIAFSPSGQSLASGSWDGNVKIWEVETGYNLRTLTGHTGEIHAVAFSPDGRFIASGGIDERVKLWDVITGQELHNLESNSGRIDDLAFSPDGKLLAAGTMHGNVIISEVNTGKILNNIPTRTGSTTDLTFSPDGRWLVWGSSMGIVTFYNLETEQEKHFKGGSLIAFGPNGHLLAIGGDDWQKLNKDKSIRILNLITGKKIISRVTHFKDVLCIAFNTDGQVVASGGGDNQVILWDVTLGRKLHSLSGHYGAVCDVAFSPDGLLLASGSDDNTIKIWDVKAGSELRTLGGFTGKFFGVAFSPDGRWLATGGTDKNVNLWELSTGIVLENFETEAGSAQNAFSEDGRWLFSWGGSGRLKIWDIVTNIEVLSLPVRVISPDKRLKALISHDKRIKIIEVFTGRVLHSLEGPREDIISMVFSPYGRFIAFSTKTIIYIWDLTTGDELQNMALEDESFLNFAFLADESSLISASRKNWKANIKVWNVQTGEEIRSFLIQSPFVNTVAFSPNGKFLSCGGFSGEISLLEIDGFSEIGTFEGHKSDICSIGFSPDGKLMASRSSENQVILWDLASRMPLKRYQLHNYRGCYSDHAVGVAFSTDGHWLSSVDGKGSVKVWNISNGKELIAPCGNKYENQRYSSSDAYSVLRNDGLIRASVDKSDHSKIKLYDVPSGKELHTLSGHKAEAGYGSPGMIHFVLPITSLRFSPDGTMLASGSADKTIKLWDVGTGRIIHDLAGHQGSILTFDFSHNGRWLVSGGEDSSVRIWDTDSGDLLATIVSINKGNDWLVVTPDGLFDGSPEAWSRMLWRFSQNTFDIAPVEVFFNEFFYPGLLAEILSGKRPKAPRDISMVDRRQPKLKLSVFKPQHNSVGKVTSRTINIRVDVTEAPPNKTHPEQGSGVYDVRIFRNGSLVKVWRGDVLYQKDGKNVLETTIPIVAGENVLTAYAFNRDNIKSKDSMMAVIGDEALKRLPKAYIIAIGINKYTDPDYDLRYAVPDAKAFCVELKNTLRRLNTFSKIETITIIDKEATKDNIIKVLDELSDDKKPFLNSHSKELFKDVFSPEPEDTVFVYFAGHGIALDDRFYILAHDLNFRELKSDLKDMNSKILMKYGISDQELEHSLEKMDAGRIVLVIDSCNSGHALEMKDKRSGPMNSRGLAQLAYEKGMHILTAAQGYQAALELSQLGHGLLTYTLIEEGLKTSVADIKPKDGQIILREWLNHASLRVPKLQLEIMKLSQEKGRGTIVILDGEENIEDPTKRTLQRPRVYYRREPEKRPLVISNLTDDEKKQQYFQNKK